LKMKGMLCFLFFRVFLLLMNSFICVFFRKQK